MRAEQALSPLSSFPIISPVLDGGFGEKIARFYGSSDVKVLNYGLKKEFLDRYNAADVMKENRLTPELIAEDAAALL